MILTDILFLKRLELLVVLKFIEGFIAKLNKLMMVITKVGI